MKRTAGILKVLATIPVVFEVIALVMMAMTPSLNASNRPFVICAPYPAVSENQKIIQL